MTICLHDALASTRRHQQQVIRIGPQTYLWTRGGVDTFLFRIVDTFLGFKPPNALYFSLAARRTGAGARELNPPR